MMCTVGGFLWDVDSLWEMYVGGTGLVRPGFFILLLSFIVVFFCGPVFFFLFLEKS